MRWINTHRSLYISQSYRRKPDLNLIVETTPRNFIN
uniref:Uncharacterized protein n=1 Tax=Rhizophora mucronata TaxID=61149 RepID=A0A2P2NZW5_RHIMU